MYKTDEQIHGPEGVYIQNYMDLRDALAKRAITDKYIKNAAKFFNAKDKDPKILDMVFKRLMVSDPYKVSIDCQTIEKYYWTEHSKQKGDEKEEEKELPLCEQNLCDGKGFVYAVKDDLYDHMFRCSCSLAKVHTGHAKRLPTWTKRYENNGYSLFNERKQHEKNYSF